MKVGDIVRIESIEWYNSRRDDSGYIHFREHDTYFSPIMSIYCGKITEIKEVIKIDDYTYFYKIDIDNKTNYWIEEMFLERDVRGSFILNDVRNYCNNLCIHTCSDICPLIKYKKGLR